MIQTGSSYTDVQAINAIANYWKHQDEWPTREEKKAGRIATVWDAALMRPHERRNVEIVTDLGMSFGSTGNLRDAAKALGVTEYEDLSPIRKRLRGWADRVSERTRLALLQFEGRSLSP